MTGRKHAKRLTETSALVLAYVIEYFIENDHIPSYRTISEHFGWASNSASYHFYGLVKLGYFEKAGSGWRFSREWEDRPRSMLASEFNRLTAEKAESEAA